MKRIRGFICTCTAALLAAQMCFGITRIYAAQDSFFDYYNQKSEYEISTEEELLELAEIIREQGFGWNVTEIYTFEGVTIKLTDDIEMTQEWMPIGPSETHPFAGTFDGNGHTISNISITDSTDSHQGVFGYVTGEIRNLNVSGTIDTSGHNAGGIAGSLAEEGVISNCTSDVQVSGNSKVGGITGENQNGTIINCFNTGAIRGNIRVGGIVGENRNGTISQCLNEGSIYSFQKGFGTYGTGGIAGRSVGGDALITKSCNRGTIKSLNECAGGIVGYCSAAGSAVSSCSNLGTVCGAEEYGYAGGIVGSISQNGIIVRNCYNTGHIKKGNYCGGILGNFTAEQQDSIETYINNNYYTDSSAARAAGLEKGTAGQRVYKNSAMVKSVNQLKNSHMPNLLGSDFQADSKGIGSVNDGFPVFSWQKTMIRDKGAILQGMEIKHKQNFIDFYNAYPYGIITPGKHLMEAVNPQMAYDEIILSIVKQKGDL